MSTLPMVMFEHDSASESGRGEMPRGRGRIKGERERKKEENMGREEER